MADDSKKRPKLTIAVDEDTLFALTQASESERIAVAAIARRALAQWANGIRSPAKVAASVLVLLAALVFGGTDARAQTVACTGPTGGNCVPVVAVQPAAGLGNFPFGSTPITATGTGSTGAISSRRQIFF